MIPEIPNAHVQELFGEVVEELWSAIHRHGTLRSPHEGHSVIREEFEELWEHVRADTGRSSDARREAVQLAAMACRYVLDLCSGPEVGCERCQLEAASPEQFRCADHSTRAAA